MHVVKWEVKIRECLFGVCVEPMNFMKIHSQQIREKLNTLYSVWEIKLSSLFNSVFLFSIGEFIFKFSPSFSREFTKCSPIKTIQMKYVCRCTQSTPINGCFCCLLVIICNQFFKRPQINDVLCNSNGTILHFFLFLFHSPHLSKETWHLC